MVVISNNHCEPLSTLVRAEDVDMRVDAQRQPRVVELHTMIIQCLCEMIELNLFGSYDQE